MARRTLLADRFRTSRVGARRGSTMLFTLLVLMMMSIAGLAMASTAIQAVHNTRVQVNASVAFNLAESGAERALLWLTAQASPPTGSASIDPFGGAQTLGATGSYQVTIVPDAGNDTSPNPRYTVVSVGTAATRVETVKVYVQTGSFGRYAYFTDYEQSSIASGAIFFKAGDSIDGPAHSNNTNNTNFNINWSSSSAPIFKDIMESVSSTINYTPSTPTNETDWGKIYKNGSRGYRLGVQRIELPDSTDRQKIAAWGDTTGFPTTNGVRVPATGATANGGIYIVGDSTVSFSTSGTNAAWQLIDVTPSGTSTITHITIKRDTNQTVVQVGSGSSTTYQGTTNGVIYSTGNITSLSGTLADNVVSGGAISAANAFTIATDVVNGKNVTITNNLQYKTAPDKTQLWNASVNLRAATLGLVARNVIIASTAPTNLTIDGVVLAGGHNTSDGSFYVTNYDTKSTGTLNLLGGVIQKKRGPVGTFNGSTGAISSGYQKNYSYDSRLATNPPPFFPTTGTYERLSWLRTSASNVGNGY